MNAHEFMAELYKGVPPEKVTYLYTLPRKQCLAYPIGQIDQMLTKADTLSASENVYWGLHLTDTAPTAGTRANAATISCISFIHGEFDVKGTAHREQALPDTLEDVISFLHSLESPPSIIVQSGNGIHTYWLLENPIIVTDENREWVKLLLRGHEKHILQQGAEHGWKFDAVADLARILRIPGTLNHKSNPPKRVEIIEASLQRYPLSAFESYISAGEAQRAEQMPFTPDPEQIGPAGKILDRCAFMQHCRDDADTLSEPEWFAMITNIALTSDGEEAVHTLSEPYGDYSYEETGGRIRRALEQQKPHTCRYIRECLGHNCPASGCGVKAPIVLAQYTIEDRVQQLMAKALTAEDVLSEKTVALMAYAKEQMPLEYSRFKLKLRPLGVSIRDFDRAVNHQVKVSKEQAIEFDSAIEDGLCVIDPTRSKRLTYSKKKTVREALPIEDAQDIICNLGKLELKDRLLVALLIFTGIRRGEALGLQWEDIDFERKLINIRRSVRFVGNRGYIGPTKSKAGVRLIPLEPQLEEILTALPRDGTYILGNGDLPITEMTYKRGWERICRTINMHGATAHVLRHTYITMAAAHLDIKTLQTIAGHSDISTTMNRYAHGREDKIIQAGGLLRDMYG